MAISQQFKDAVLASEDAFPQISDELLGEAQLRFFADYVKASNSTASGELIGNFMNSRFIEWCEQKNLSDTQALILFTINKHEYMTLVDNQEKENKR